MLDRRYLTIAALAVLLTVAATVQAASLKIAADAHGVVVTGPEFTAHALTASYDEVEGTLVLEGSSILPVTISATHDGKETRYKGDKITIHLKPGK